MVDISHDLLLEYVRDRRIVPLSKAPRPLCPTRCVSGPLPHVSIMEEPFEPIISKTYRSSMSNKKRAAGEDANDKLNEVQLRQEIEARFPGMTDQFINAVKEHLRKKYSTSDLTPEQLSKGYYQAASLLHKVEKIFGTQLPEDTNIMQVCVPKEACRRYTQGDPSFCEQQTPGMTQCNTGGLAILDANRVKDLQRDITSGFMSDDNAFEFVMNCSSDTIKNMLARKNVAIACPKIWGKPTLESFDSDIAFAITFDNKTNFVALNTQGDVSERVVLVFDRKFAERTVALHSVKRSQMQMKVEETRLLSTLMTTLKDYGYTEYFSDVGTRSLVSLEVRKQFIELFTERKKLFDKMRNNKALDEEYVELKAYLGQVMQFPDSGLFAISTKPIQLKDHFPKTHKWSDPDEWDMNFDRPSFGFDPTDMAKYGSYRTVENDLGVTLMALSTQNTSPAFKTKPFTTASSLYDAMGGAPRSFVQGTFMTGGRKEVMYQYVTDELPRGYFDPDEVNQPKPSYFMHEAELAKKVSDGTTLYLTDDQSGVVPQIPKIVKFASPVDLGVDSTGNRRSARYFINMGPWDYVKDILKRDGMGNIMNTPTGELQLAADMSNVGDVIDACMGAKISSMMEIVHSLETENTGFTNMLRKRLTNRESSEKILHDKGRAVLGDMSLRKAIQFYNMVEVGANMPEKATLELLVKKFKGEPSWALCESIVAHMISGADSAIAAAREDVRNPVFSGLLYLGDQFWRVTKWTIELALKHPMLIVAVCSVISFIKVMLCAADMLRALNDPNDEKVQIAFDKIAWRLCNEASYGNATIAYGAYAMLRVVFCFGKSIYAFSTAAFTDLARQAWGCSKSLLYAMGSTTLKIGYRVANLAIDALNAILTRVTGFLGLLGNYGDFQEAILDMFSITKSDVDSNAYASVMMPFSPLRMYSKYMTAYVVVSKLGKFLGVLGGAAIKMAKNTVLLVPCLMYRMFETVGGMTKDTVGLVGSALSEYLISPTTALGLRILSYLANVFDAVFSDNEATAGPQHSEGIQASSVLIASLTAIFGFNALDIRNAGVESFFTARPYMTTTIFAIFLILLRKKFPDITHTIAEGFASIMSFIYWMIVTPYQKINKFTKALYHYLFNTFPAHALQIFKMYVMIMTVTLSMRNAASMLYCAFKASAVYSVAKDAVSMSTVTQSMVAPGMSVAPDPISSSFIAPTMDDQLVCTMTVLSDCCDPKYWAVVSAGMHDATSVIGAQEALEGTFGRVKAAYERATTFHGFNIFGENGMAHAATEAGAAAAQRAAEAGQQAADVAQAAKMAAEEAAKQAGKAATQAAFNAGEAATQAAAEAMEKAKVQTQAAMANMAQQFGEKVGSASELHSGAEKIWKQTGEQFSNFQSMFKAGMESYSDDAAKDPGSHSMFTTFMAEVNKGKDGMKAFADSVFSEPMDNSDPFDVVKSVAGSLEENASAAVASATTDAGLLPNFGVSMMSVG